MTEAKEIYPIKLKGIPASPGIAVGRLRLLPNRDLEIPSENITEEEVKVHLERAEKVLFSVEHQLKDLQQSQNNTEVRDILDAQIQIVKDPELKKKVFDLINHQKRSAEFALYSSFNEFIQLLQQTGQEWVKDRIVDLQSLRDKIIHQTLSPGVQKDRTKGEILFAEELSPTDIIEYNDSGVEAVVMKHGGTTSHAVIIAQSLEIPCVAGADWLHSQVIHANMVAVDAELGEVILNPDSEVLEQFRVRKENRKKASFEAMEIGKKPDTTRCGIDFNIRANIEFEVELKKVKNYRAKGVGLLRTETLFLQQGYFDPGRHLDFYRLVLEQTASHPVTVRLLDVGGDKLLGRKLDEANPFLGWRGCRMLLEEDELLESQLRVILTVASEFPGRVEILVPMITDVSEIHQINLKVDQVKAALKKEGLEINEKIPVGAMIEVPAIALQADEAAEAADFFSIGSNDLTQYVLAVDRGNERISAYFRSGHPAVLKMISMAYKAANKANIPVSVCGEMAGNPLLAAALLGMGIRDLSMNPASIASVKRVLCENKIDTFKSLYHSLIHSSDGVAADQVIRDWREAYLH